MRNLTILLIPIYFALFLASPAFNKGESIGASWMSEYSNFLGNVPLNQIFIPGSHDAHTYDLELKMAKNQEVTEDINKLKFVGVGFAVNEIVRNWTKTQKLSIYEQLVSGVRFIDLRVTYRDSKKEFYTVHGLYGPSLKTILKDINRFLLEQPREIVIIQVGNMRYMPEGQKSHDKLKKQLKEAFGSKLAGKDDIKSARSATLETMWNLGKQVILIYDKHKFIGDDDREIWPKNDILVSKWADKNTTSALKEKLDSFMTEKRENDDNGKRFYVVQSQMTATSDNYKKGLIPFSGNPKSLEDFAKQVQKKFPKWLDEWKQRNPNIILLDFVDQKTSKMIYSINEEKFNR